MKEFIKTIAWVVIVVVFLAVVGRVAFFSIAKTESYSMVPSILGGDVILVWRLGKLGPGDIAVCRNPENPSTMVVGRILGVPGSTFRMKDNYAFINDSRLKHPEGYGMLTYVDRSSDEEFHYAVDQWKEHLGGHLYVVGQMVRAGDKDFRPYTVEEGFFLVGDNRNMSRDSRHFGEVPIDSCIGRAIIILWPAEDNGDFRRLDRFMSWID
jgi:signal peptidase I